MRKLGIYVHIPFCVRKCRYCDFLSFPAAEETQWIYVRALQREIEWESGRKSIAADGIKKTEKAGKTFQDTGFIVDTVFIGGGTPSVLPEGALEEILDCLRQCYRFPACREPEITVEVNPGTVDRKKLESYRKAGVNRISIGTQSVHGQELAYLGRVHSAADFFRTYRDTVEAGFTNINVDIMAALPGQSVTDYMDNLSQVAGLYPAHISAYSLIIEEGTPFYDLYGEERRSQESCGTENGSILPLPSEDEEREMYERTDAFLREKGYRRYEISNYAMPGRECRHNKGYWTRQDYVGFGLGAASMVGNVRWKNRTSMDEYLRLAGTEGAGVKQEIHRLDKREQMEEFMFLGLRLTEGVGRREFWQTFGVDVEEVYGAVLGKMRAQGLLETDERIRLTNYGRDVSNYVMAEFLLDTAAGISYHKDI